MGNQVFRSPKVSRCLENHKSPLGPPSTLASQSGWQAHQPGKGVKGVKAGEGVKGAEDVEGEPPRSAYFWPLAKLID